MTAALVSLGLAKLWQQQDGKLHHAGEVTLLDLAIVIGCLALDLWRFSTIDRWQRDFGVGEVEVEIATSGSPYRQEPKVVSIVRGNAERARHLLRRQLRFGLVVLGLSLTALLL
jgi:hypothetical protein